MIDIIKGTDEGEKLTGKESKKGRWIALVVVLLLAAGGYVGGISWMKAHRKADVAATPEQTMDAVRAADAKLAKAAAARDVDGTVALYADDAVVMPPNQAMAMDKLAERKAWSDIMVPGAEITLTSGKIEAAKSGDIAYDVGVYTLITKGKKGALTTDGGKYLMVWKKQSDGNWKAEAVEWNSDKALPGMKTAG